MTIPKERTLPYPTAQAAVKAAAAASLVLMAGACGQQTEVKSDTPSGYPVPRWVSVGGAPASMRAGPGLDYPILWQFERAGAPLQVVTETEEWRKVCGPDGSIAWIHRSLTSGRRRAIAVEAAEVRADPQADSTVRAHLAARAMIGLEGCEDGWCEVRSGEIRGWAPQSALFGTADQALCDPRAPATRGELVVNATG